MNNKIALSSLAMDLKRVALAYYRGSLKTADRFLEEALKRVGEINKSEISPNIIKVLNNIEKLGSQTDKKDAAEDALMYSTLIQNAALYQKNL